MLEINDESYSLNNSIVDGVIAVVIIFIVIYIVFMVKVFIENNEIIKRNKIIVELLDNIKNYNDENFEKFQSFLQQNTDLINFVYGPAGNTPFLVACEFGATKIVQEMLKLGADIRYCNYAGNGPLYLSIYYMIKNMDLRDATLIRTLYYCGCDINLRNKNGYTPLHLAAYYGHIPLLYWLVNKGAKVDIPPLPSGIALANGKTTAAYLLCLTQCENNENSKLFETKELKYNSQYM